MLWQPFTNGYFVGSPPTLLWWSIQISPLMLRYHLPLMSWASWCSHCIRGHLDYRQTLCTIVSETLVCVPPLVHQALLTGKWPLTKSKFKKKKDKKFKEEIKHEPHVFGNTRQCWQHYITHLSCQPVFPIPAFLFNLLKTKRNLLYIRNQSVPHSKHVPPWLQKPIS